MTAGGSAAQRALLIVAADQTRHQISDALADVDVSVVSNPSVDEVQQEDIGSFDLVIADATDDVMPIVRSVSADGSKSACILIATGGNDSALATAMGLGIYGYMKPPLSAGEIRMNAQHAMGRQRTEHKLHTRNSELERMVNDRTSELWQAVTQIEKGQQELRASREETVQRLALAIELKDGELRPHLDRMSRYCGLLAKQTGLDDQLATTTRVASLMHDVGKAGIPDEILTKEGKFRPAERELAKSHCLIGHRILDGSDSELIQMGATIALTHHERWDGTGYPRGMREEAIPLSGRIAAIADVFDALTTQRPYRKALHIQQAADAMQEGRGSQFDPDLLELFLDSIDEVVRVMEHYPDAERAASVDVTETTI